VKWKRACGKKGTVRTIEAKITNARKAADVRRETRNQLVPAAVQGAQQLVLATHVCLAGHLIKPFTTAIPIRVADLCDVLLEIEGEPERHAMRKTGKWYVFRHLQLG